jgi:hypothetical protein
MMRFFLNPWMLAALGGVLVPVLIELLFRRRRRRVELPTLRYLLGTRAEKKVKRQDRILLLLRCMVPLVLAFALARPMLAPEGAVETRGRHVVLVVDDTLSMAQQAGVSTAFAFARRKAAGLVRLLPEGTHVSLVTLGHRPELKLDRTDDLYAASERIEAMKISHGAGTIAEALPILRKAMTPADPDENQELYLFSDFQKTTWLRRSSSREDPVRGIRALGESGDVFLVDAGPPRPKGAERPFNCFATGLAPEEPLLVTGRTVRFRAVVETRGGLPPDGTALRLTFLVDGEKKAMREVTPAGGGASAFFDHRFARAGEYLVELAAEGDGSPIDNRRFYLASVRESLPVLVLDDSAVGGRTSTEAAFLTAAVAPREQPGLDRTSIFSAKVIHPVDIIRENLRSCVAVVVLAVERVGDDLTRELEPYVRDGGSVVFFLGGRANPWEYNERLHRGGAGVLPVRVGQSQPADDDTASAGLGIRAVSVGHPAFAFFGESDLLAEAGVLRWTSLAESPGTGVIAQFTSGKPAIVEKALGRGRVVAFCCAAGPPESLLPAGVHYPVVLQEMLRYLAGDPDGSVNLVDGDAFAEEVMISAQHLVLRKPDGVKVRLTPVKLGPPGSPQADRLGIVFDGTDRMGQYHIDAQPGVLRRTRFVVNLRPIEGDLDRLEREEALAAFGDAAWLAPGAPMETIVREKYASREIAAALLWTLAALLAVETFAAMRFGRRRR